MYSKVILLWIIALAFVNESKAWLWGKNEEIIQQNPLTGLEESYYYFGTTSVRCVGISAIFKRAAVPMRSTLLFRHRFLFYRGYYFELLGNSNASISKQPKGSDECIWGLESSPAGSSNVDVDCIKGCARNYRCEFGDYDLWNNNCHMFANRLSEVLYTNEKKCPSWCLGDCYDAEED